MDVGVATGSAHMMRVADVDGRPVRIYDGLVSPAAVGDLTNSLLGAAFVCDEVARPDTYAARHWQLGIPLEVARRLALFDPTVAKVRELTGEACYEVKRVYCNFATYGDMLFTHTDVLPGRRGITALWYVAPSWNVEWGGETILYNADRDAVVCVTPRPGRLLVFDGSILHAGRPPNRICYAPRYTLAFKFEPG